MRFAKQIVLVFLLCASTSTLTMLSAGTAKADASAPAADKARIVFLRLKQAVGSDVAAQLLEVIDDRPQFVAQLWQGEKLVVETTPGPKKFMTFGRSGDLLFGDLLGGKTYYVVLRYHLAIGAVPPNPVQATGSFRRDSPLVLNAINTYQAVTPTAADRDRFRHEIDSSFVQTEYERVSALFARKSASQLAERTLRPEDGSGDLVLKTPMSLPPAAATPASPPATVAPVGTANRASGDQRSAETDSPSAKRLKELQLLLDRGLITTDEYQEKRRAILKDL